MKSALEATDQLANPERPRATPSSTRLEGHLGTMDLVLAALAYAGPLAGTAGYVALVIGEGNGLGAPLAYLSVMVVLLFFSVGYSALTRHVPNPGAFYAYVTAGFGREAGLGAAFLITLSYLVIGIGCYAFAGLGAAQLIEGLSGPELPWWICAIFIWAGVTGLGHFHVAISAKVLGVLLVAEVLVIFIFDAVIMANGGPEGISFEPFTWSSYTTGNLGVSLIFAIALFSGFEATAIYREETRNPDRTIPRATYIVVLFIGLFYALSAWTMITALGPSQAVSLAHADPANVFFGAATQFGGAWLYLSASVLLVTSMFAACLAIQNVTTRYIYSMSVDGILPRAMGVAHERHHSPHRASFAVGMFYFIGTGTSLLAGLSGENIYAWFAGMAAFGLICALAITSGAVIAYFLRHPGVATVWKGVIAPSIALIGLLVFVYLGYENFPALIGGSRVMANFMTVTFAVVFGLGYFIAASLRRNRPDVYARIGRQ